MPEEFNPPVLPVLTQQKKVRVLWIILINLSWFVGLYTIHVMGTTVPLSMRRFTADTRIIGLVTSVGLWFGIVLGPLASYVSDRIWTRFGRRRPFLLLASVGSLLAPLLIPFVPSLAPLVWLVVISSILGDFACAQEPLWMEVVPHQQRGQGFAIRVLMTNMASLIYFQIMFAQFDHKYHLPGGFSLNGEQVIYLSAAFLQAGYFIFLAFFVREVFPEGANLQRPQEIRSDRLIAMIRAAFQKKQRWHYLILSPLPAPIMIRIGAVRGFGWVNLLLFPWTFLLRFFRDVFGEARWWWVYLFVFAGILVGNGTRNPFWNLMLIDQFHYTKPAIALTGLPVMILSNVLVTPFMAWFADRLPRLSVTLMGGTIAACGIALYYLMTFWSNIPKGDLPPFWGMMLIALFAFVGSGATILLCFQVARAWKPAANPRIWAWLLLHFKTVLHAAIMYVLIKGFATSGVPSITVWFLMMCFTAGISCLQIVAGPLLYDFIPKDKIGTLSSGFGLLSTAVGAVITTLVGSWIYYASSWTSGGTTRTDYTSAYLFQILVGLIGLIMVVFFFFRVLSGKIIEYGRLDLNSNESPPIEVAEDKILVEQLIPPSVVSQGG